MRADEIMYLGEWRSDTWTVNWKFAGGKNIPDTDELADSFNLPDALEPQFDSADVWHFQILADYDGGRIRMGYSEYDTPNRYSLRSTYLAGEIASSADSHWRIVSFEYNALKWNFTTELERAEFSYHGLSIDPADPDYQDFPESAYAQFGWNLTPKHTLYVRKELMHFNRYDHDGSEYVEFPGATLLGTQKIDRYAHISMLGWSFRPTPTWLIRFDVSKNTGVMHVTQRDAPSGFEPRKEWTSAAFAVSWRF